MIRYLLSEFSVVFLDDFLKAFLDGEEILDGKDEVSGYYLGCPEMISQRNYSVSLKRQLVLLLLLLLLLHRWPQQPHLTIFQSRQDLLAKEVARC